MGRECVPHIACTTNIRVAWRGKLAMLLEFALCLKHLAALAADVITVSSLGLVRLERVRVVERERTD